MRFGILGRLQVVDESGRSIPITAARQRTLLAALLLRPNQIVPGDLLAEILWDGEPPQGAISTLRTYVMRLRKALGAEGAARIETRDPGYLIRLEAEELDLDVFTAHSARTQAAMREAGDWQSVARSASAALALWRETPLIDIPSQVLHNEWLPLLEMRHLQVMEWRIEADLMTGGTDALIPEVSALIKRHPLRESLYRLLMLSLAHAGQTGEALAVYRDARATLVEQLGTGPGPVLQRLHQEILRGESSGPPATALPRKPAVRRAETGRGEEASEPNSPRQLPNNTGAFVGRDRELAQLAALAESAGTTDACETVVVSAIDGMGGVGKTALAVRAAHQASALFPDGQLFVDLRGHLPGDTGLTAHDALASLLRALGVPGTKIPAETDARSALYRSRLAGTRTLVLLDNAATAAQIRPLVPASPGSLVIVTSRSTLAGLDDAHFLRLDVLAESEAVALLHRIAGPGRLPAQHPALLELVALCGGLPLALRIAAAHLRHERHLDLGDYVTEIRDNADRLSALNDGERNLSAVFDSSYAALSPAEQQLFRLLGLIPGFDFDAYVAANLLDTELRTAERLLELLLSDNLLVQRNAGRYEFHDLVRAYARRIGEPRDQVASSRLFDYYEATARRADRRLALHSVPVEASRPEPEVGPDFGDAGMATAWMRSERDNLLAAVRARDTSPARALALTQALAAFLQQNGPWSEAAGLHAAAADIARDTDNTLAQAHAQWSLGRIRFITGQYQAAVETLHAAVETYRRLDRQVGEANARWDLGRALQFTGAPADAADQYNQALALYHVHGDTAGEAHALHELARLRYIDSDLPTAARLEAQALSAYQQTANRLGEANALLGLGKIHHAEGDLEAAAGLLEQAMLVYQSLRSHFGEANALIAIGRVRQATGEPAAAAELYELALAHYRNIGGRQGEANAVLDLGRAQQDLGRVDAAADLYAQAKLLFQELKDPHGSAQVLNSIGSLYPAVGDPRGALASYRGALDLARESGSHDEEVRARDGIRSVLAMLAAA